ncbi:MAG TPA: hypothetical protein VEH28_03480 [Thermoplasmata archaeon]|nr:hypothetical protein [Thermoplasmata archaeon]
MMPTATAPPEGATNPPLPSPPPPTFPGAAPPPSPLTPPRRSWIWIAVVVAAVVIVVLAVLFVAGVFSSNAGTSSVPDGTPVPYSKAVAVAISEGQVAVGGPWTVVVGLGIGVSSGLSEPLGPALTGNGCAYANPPGAPSSVVIPGTPSNATPGEVASWVFLAKNVSGTVILMMFVSDGTASPVSYVTGCSGVASFSAESAINATNVVDSTTIAASLDASGGSAFLANHTSATKMFVILGAGSAFGGSAFWEASYSTCGFGAVGGSGAAFVAYYYASSGSIFNGPTSSQITC